MSPCPLLDKVVAGCSSDTLLDFAVRQLCWSPVGLFRFSALTFNGHQIHYNAEWAQTVEGHPSIVVHGPLNPLNILNYWRDIHGR